jgi:hypothetical protein
MYTFIAIGDRVPEKNDVGARSEAESVRPGSSTYVDQLDAYIQSTFVTNAGSVNASASMSNKDTVVSELREYFHTEAPVSVKTDVMEFWIKKKKQIPYFIRNCYDNIRCSRN